MTYIIAASACIMLLGIYTSPAAATQPEEAAQLEIDGVLPVDQTGGLVDAIDAMIETSSTEAVADLSFEASDLPEPSAAAATWDAASESGVAIPVTSDLSLGVDYELEELEELTADRIEMGSASADHASHNVMIRAQWQFDLPQ